MTCCHTDMSMEWTYAEYMSIKVYNVDIYDPQVHNADTGRNDMHENIVKLTCRRLSYVG